MAKISTEAVAELVGALNGSKPGAEQAERIAKATAAFSATLDVTAAQSLFDTEPEQLQAVLRELAEDDGASA